MIRKHKTTIFTDAKENTSVAELKRMLEGKQSTTSLELKKHTMCVWTKAQEFGGDFLKFKITNCIQDSKSPTFRLIDFKTIYSTFYQFKRNIIHFICIKYDE